MYLYKKKGSEAAKSQVPSNTATTDHEDWCSGSAVTRNITHVLLILLALSGGRSLWNVGFVP